MMEQSRHVVTEEMLQLSAASDVKAEAKDVTIKSFEISAGSRKGENYACKMEAVELTALVKGEEEARRLWYMAKCLPTTGELKGAFDIEIEMYGKILPNLSRIESERNLYPKLSVPKVFYNKTGVIIMEDLRKLDYFLIEKTRGLDVAEMKLVLEQLAVLHATSYHLMATYPGGGVQKFMEDHPTLVYESWFQQASATDMFHQMFEVQCNILEDIVEEHGDDPELAQKLKDFGKARKAIINELHRPQGSFNCVIHNDAWRNNFLFCKSKHETVDNLKMLDFQLCRRARPAIDLVYLLCTSTTPEFRQDNLDHLLQHYHSILLQRLRDLGPYDEDSLYPFDQLLRDYRECLPHGFVSSIMHVMIQLTPKDNEDATFDPDKLKDEESFRITMAKFRRAQVELSREDLLIRNRLVAIAKEALRFGII